MRKDLYKNIVLSGATTMFAGYASRLMIEMKKIYREKGLQNVENIRYLLVRLFWLILIIVLKGKNLDIGLQNEIGMKLGLILF